jgi:Mlc titration factor MtfA (ptsG expression regulator)
MDELDPSGILRFVVVFGLMLAYLLFRLKQGGYLRVGRGLQPGQRAILSKYAIHYQRLGAVERDRFERIVASFVHDKEWRGVGMRVEEEMKVMVGACAAELLLGFPDVVLKHFNKILIYPDAYRSRLTGRMHLGEVRPKPGMIIISWRDFLHGYAHTRDAHNVGLHELAHALWFENKIRNGEHNFLHPELLQDWVDHADAEMERIQQGRSRLFRSYAGTNHEEFFAVAVEYFFEQPVAFKDDLPELYGTLSAMLRQDPAAVAERAA